MEFSQIVDNNLNRKVENLIEKLLNLYLDSVVYKSKKQLILI